MTSIIMFTILCLLSSCSHLAEREEGRPIDVAVHMEYNGSTMDLIPFVYNVQRERGAEIYYDGTIAVKIDSIHIDGKLLNQKFGDVCFDEIDLSSHVPLNSTYIHFFKSELIISMIDLSPDGFRAVGYCLPDNYSKAVIVYEIRDVAGLTGIKNTVTLYQEGTIPKREGPIDFSDSPDY